ncbi:MAG: nucleotidyl transferase AbiEii/AbiGii toxin family protein [Planctomycetes bacterium]|nr:nucleotidyl transferase AbiEii/AbiGii toxin family protein [Planctomycetota bacterium]
MDEFAVQSASYREEVFQETAARMGITPQVVEKDFWVTWTLGNIYSNEVLAKKLTFKGGTSLSKVFGLIERFSEDVDLVLNWSVLGVGDPEVSRSKTKQDHFNHLLLEKAQEYLANTLLGELKEALDPTCKIEVDEADPYSLMVTYPASFPDTYVRPQIKLEVGPLASREPRLRHEITSYAALQFPEQFHRPKCVVQVIRAERTFWEKVTILHREAHRKDRPIPSRYSRHYYDLYKLANSGAGKRALADLQLLAKVVDFKSKFYPQAWARYDLAVPGTIRLLPPTSSMRTLETDYNAMRAMIFGDIPPFDELVQGLVDLETRLNS